MSTPVPPLSRAPVAGPQYMDVMDDHMREMADLDDELARAVADERYEDAAAHKKELEGFMATDVMFAALTELEEATTEERCGRLRPWRSHGWPFYWVERLARTV